MDGSRKAPQTVKIGSAEVMGTGEHHARVVASRRHDGRGRLATRATGISTATSLDPSPQSADLVDPRITFDGCGVGGKFKKLDHGNANRWIER